MFKKYLLCVRDWPIGELETEQDLMEFFECTIGFGEVVNVRAIK